MGDEGKPLLHPCLEWARKLSTDEIRTALRFLHEEFKGLDAAAVLALRPGDWVEMTKTVRRLPAGARGQVTAVRRGRIDVHFPEFQCYIMPASMVRKVDGSPARPSP
jgi:hypothetical protein